MSIIRYAIFDSSLGTMLFVSRDNALARLEISQDDPSIVKNRFMLNHMDAVETIKSFLTIARELDRYIKGENMVFHVPIDLSLLPPFTQEVLKEVKTIPYGETRTYGWVSKRLGFKNAARAVGNALKANPIPIIIPCHRVIREDGSIGGFSLGVHMKKRLLSIEGIEL
ncbi:MAG TPA: methylated-DNA--[protein]-cysteine S-methyltransferase [Syntrophorhabdaceae bacterium]|nr:methylated-DNA--[protein]-cysteine S-methyltransferase [Syntrophorhabdaceae bacterium]